MFDAGRRSAISAIEQWKPSISSNLVYWLCTLILIPIFSLIAVFVDSLGLVVGLTGSLLGITVGFSLPGLLLARRARLIGNKRQEILGYCLMSFGILMTVLGVTSIFLHVTPTEV